MFRRPRYGLDRNPILLLVVLAVILTVWQHRARATTDEARSPKSPPERLATALAWPLQQVFSSLANNIGQTAVSLGQSRRLAAENHKLRADNEELRAQQLKLIDALIENQQLKKILGFRSGASPEPLPARVVAINFGLSRKRLTIAAPPGRELEVGNIVRTPAGLVGRIIEARGNRGEVFPLIDSEHAVSGLVLRSRDQGIVRVQPRPRNQPDVLVLDKLVGRADIREGDVLLTSGLGEVYPRGIPIGTVMSVRRSVAGTVDLSATIRPFVDFDHLEFVLVERHGR